MHLLRQMWKDRGFSLGKMILPLSLSPSSPYGVSCHHSGFWFRFGSPRNPSCPQKLENVGLFRQKQSWVFFFRLLMFSCKLQNPILSPHLVLTTFLQGGWEGIPSSRKLHHLDSLVRSRIKCSAVSWALTLAHFIPEPSSQAKTFSISLRARDQVPGLQ